MKKLILALLIATILLAVIFANMLTTNATSYQIDKNINEIMNNVADMSVSNPQLALSSNPYTYVTDNVNYKNIVKLGRSALPYIKNKINSSSENGLREYILAIAAEEIAKVDLKGDNYGWSNGKAWAKAWDNHLKNVPTDVENIISSNEKDELKINKLVKLGIPAIPFIMDGIEQGHTELSPALDELLKGSNEVTGTIADYIQWVTANKKNFDDLRTLVSEAGK